jgi:hypothetical protein
MGAINSSNVQTQARVPHAQHAQQDSTFVGIPTVVVEQFKSTFLSRKQELVDGILKYYKGHPSHKVELLRGITAHMVRVRFDPQDRDVSTLALISLYGPVPAARLECHNTLSMDRQVGSGTYGTVWMARVNGHHLAVKIGNGEEQQSLLEEAMLLVLLTSSLSRACFEGQMRALHVDGITALPFPQVNFLVRNASVRRCKLMMGMQPLDLTFQDMVIQGDPAYTEGDFADVLAQLLQQLYLVQKVYGFQHKDMKTDNVMLQRRPTPVNVIRRIGDMGPSGTFISRFEVMFIDLGSSCANMHKCGLDLQLENYNTFYDQAKVLCSNRSYDLMLFFVSLIPYMPGFIARQQGSGMAEWWQEVIDPVVNLATAHGIDNIDTKSYLCVYNEHMLRDMKSDGVRPEVLFCRLVTAMNKREVARIDGIIAQKVQRARVISRAEHRRTEFLRVQRTQLMPPPSPSWKVAPLTDDDISSSDIDTSSSDNVGDPPATVREWKEYQ